jgi:hypothetical protein
MAVAAADNGRLRRKLIGTVHYAGQESGDQERIWNRATLTMNRQTRSSHESK